MVADLRGNGITEYGVLNTRGYHYFNKGQYMAAELIVNGENQTLARYPNEGTIPVKNKNLLPEEMSFIYDNDRPSSMANAKDSWICGTLSINYDGEGVEGIEFTNCQIRNFGQGGLIFRGTKIKLENNEIKNIGGTGIFISGGDYETLTSSENTIISNTIHRVGY